MNDLHLVPVGVIHSSVTSPKEMPSLGVDGEIELFPFYADALGGIDGSFPSFRYRLDAQGGPDRPKGGSEEDLS